MLHRLVAERLAASPWSDRARDDAPSSPTAVADDDDDDDPANRSNKRKHFVNVRCGNGASKTFAIADDTTFAQASKEILGVLFHKKFDGDVATRVKLVTNVATAENLWSPEDPPSDESLVEYLTKLSIDFLRGFGNNGNELARRTATSPPPPSSPLRGGARQREQSPQFNPDLLPPLYLIETIVTKPPLQRPPSAFFRKRTEIRRSSPFEAFVTMTIRDDVKEMANRPSREELKELMDFSWCLSTGGDVLTTRLSCATMGEALFLPRLEAEDLWMRVFAGIVRGTSSHSSHTVRFAEFNDRWLAFRRARNRAGQSLGKVADARVQELFDAMHISSQRRGMGRPPLGVALDYLAFALHLTMWGLALAGSFVMLRTLLPSRLAEVFPPVPLPALSSPSFKSSFTSFLSTQVLPFAQAYDPSHESHHQSYLDALDVRQMRVRHLDYGFPPYSTSDRSTVPLTKTSNSTTNSSSPSLTWGLFTQPLGDVLPGAGVTSLYDASGYPLLFTPRRNATNNVTFLVTTFDDDEVQGIILNGTDLTTRLLTVETALVFPSSWARVLASYAFEYDAAGRGFVHLAQLAFVPLPGFAPSTLPLWAAAAGVGGASLIAGTRAAVRSCRGGTNAAEANAGAQGIASSSTSGGILTFVCAICAFSLCAASAAASTNFDQSPLDSALFASAVIAGGAVVALSGMRLKRRWAVHISSLSLSPSRSGLPGVMLWYGVLLVAYAAACEVWFGVFVNLLSGGYGTSPFRDFANTIFSLLVVSTRWIYLPPLVFTGGGITYFLGVTFLASFVFLAGVARALASGFALVNYRRALAKTEREARVLEARLGLVEGVFY